MSTQPDVKILVWLSMHHGTLSKIALELNCSSQFVSMVLRGKRKSRDGKVERALRAEGAPI